MKNLYLTMTALAITFSAAAQKQPQPSDPHYLKTGWYYVSETKTDYPRKNGKQQQVCFIDPNVIVSVKHFGKMKYVTNKPNADVGNDLVMQFDSIGIKLWSIATGKSIGRKIALIIDNKMIYAPKVSAQIDSGVCALNSPDYTNEELEVFEKIIKSEAH